MSFGIHPVSTLSSIPWTIPKEEIKDQNLAMVLNDDLHFPISLGLKPVEISNTKILLRDVPQNQYPIKRTNMVPLIIIIATEPYS